MTISSQTSKVTASGNDVATTFSFSPIVIFESGNLVVVVKNAAGTETTISEGTGSTNYSVSVSSYPGTGSITYPASGGTPLATGATITIKRVLTLEQALDLENQGGYFAELQETAFDKAIAVDIQQQEELDRSLKGPVSFSGTFGELDTPVASKYVRRNAANDGYEHVAITTTDAAASDVAPVDVSLTAAAAGSSDDFSREDHTHLLPTVSVAKGGTGSTTASGARTALGAAALGANTFTGLQTLDSTGVAFTTTTITDTIDDDTMATATAGKLATSESIKAYVDTEVAAAGTGALEFVGTVAIPAQATISIASGGSPDITHAIADGYDYMFQLNAFCPANDGVILQMKISDDNGTSYEGDASDYGWGYVTHTSGFQDDDDTLIRVVSDLGNDTSNASLATIEMIDPGNTSEYRLLKWDGVAMTTDAVPDVEDFHGGGVVKNAAAAINGIQFYFSAGNFKAQGDMTVWRRKRS